MSEKAQRTALSMRENMLNRYGDVFEHKHNKYRLSHRQHWRTHPVSNHLIDHLLDEAPEHDREGMKLTKRKEKTKKLRKCYPQVTVH